MDRAVEGNEAWSETVRSRGCRRSTVRSRARRHSPQQDDREKEDEGGRGPVATFFLLLSYTSCGQQQMMLPCGSQAMASSPQAIPFLAELSFFAAFTLHLAFPAQVHQQILHCLHITTRCLQCQKEIYVKGLTDERFSHRRAFEHGHTHLISGTSQS